MLEKVAKAVQAVLVADIAAQLDVVEAYWTAQDDTVTLEDVQTWLLGHHPTILERKQSDFPIVSIIALSEDSESQTDQWGYGESVIPCIVHWFVDADSEANCNKIVWRYGEAIDAVIRAHRHLAAGINVQGYIAKTEVSLVTRETPELGTSADYFFTQMGVKTWQVRVEHYT